MINYYYFIDVSPLLSSLFLLQQPHLQLKHMLRERHVKYSYFVWLTLFDSLRYLQKHIFLCS